MKIVGQLALPDPLPPDTRRCILCHQMADGAKDVTSRLLNYDVDKWVHLNCALWSTEVRRLRSPGVLTVNTSIIIIVL